MDVVTIEGWDWAVKDKDPKRKFSITFDVKRVICLTKNLNGCLIRLEDFSRSFEVTEEDYMVVLDKMYEKRG